MKTETKPNETRIEPNETEITDAELLGGIAGSQGHSSGKITVNVTCPGSAGTGGYTLWYICKN